MQQELDGEKWFIAYCNEFGLNACHGTGDTQEEALQDFSLEKEGFIEFLYNKGEAIPEVESFKNNEHSGVLTVRMPPMLHSKIARDAKENKLSINSYINYRLAYDAGLNDCATEIQKTVMEVSTNINSQFSALRHFLSQKARYEFKMPKSPELKAYNLS